MNPYIVDKSAPFDIEGTLTNTSFALSALKHSLDSEGGEDVTLPYDVAQGCVLTLAGVISAIFDASEQVGLMRRALTDPDELREYLASKSEPVCPQQLADLTSQFKNLKEAV